jgi:hypothetical protein
MRSVGQAATGSCQRGRRDRRRAGLVWPAAAVTLAVAGLALGCASGATVSSVGTHGRETTSAGRGQPRGLAPPLAWAVPVAYLEGRTADGHVARQRATVIASHWLGTDGTVHATNPNGEVVRWPAPLAVLPSGSLTIRVAAPDLPVRMEVLSYPGNINPAGVPTRTGLTAACTRGAPNADACRYSVTHSYLAVSLAAPAYRPSALIVLYGEWYIPAALRPATRQGTSIDNASWGFRVTANPS